MNQIKCSCKKQAVKVCLTHELYFCNQDASKHSCELTELTQFYDTTIKLYQEKMNVFRNFKKEKSNFMYAQKIHNEDTYQKNSEAAKTLEGLFDKYLEMIKTKKNSFIKNSLDFGQDQFEDEVNKLEKQQDLFELRKKLQNGQIESIKQRYAEVCNSIKEFQKDDYLVNIVNQIFNDLIKIFKQQFEQIQGSNYQNVQQITDSAKIIAQIYSDQQGAQQILRYISKQVPFSDTHIQQTCMIETINDSIKKTEQKNPDIESIDSEEIQYISGDEDEDVFDKVRAEKRFTNLIAENFLHTALDPRQPMQVKQQSMIQEEDLSGSGSNMSFGEDDIELDDDINSVERNYQDDFEACRQKFCYTLDQVLFDMCSLGFFDKNEKSKINQYFDQFKISLLQIIGDLKSNFSKIQLTFLFNFLFLVMIFNFTASILIFIFLFIQQIISNIQIDFDKTFAVLTSLSNSSTYSDYTFNLKLPIDIYQQCFLKINFPEQNFVKGMGLMKPLIQIKQNDTLYNVETTIKEYDIYIYSKQIKISKGDISLMIREILNPYQTGGSGFFIVQQLCENQIIVQSKIIPQVGITQPIELFLKASVKIYEGSSDQAGTESKYVFNFATSSNITKDSFFKLVFPYDYDFSLMKEEKFDFQYHNFCTSPLYNDYKLEGQIYCEFTDKKNELIIKGYEKDIEKGQEFQILIEKVINPQYQKFTDFFQVQIIKQNSSHILQSQKSIRGVQIQPGMLKDVQLLSSYNQFLTNDQQQFVIQFYPQNPFHSLIVVTQFRQVTKCSIVGGLKRHQINESINCNFKSNIIKINNFQFYQKSGKSFLDLIKIKIEAILPNIEGKTLPFQIYTYYDQQFYTKADQNTDSEETRIKIQKSIDIQPETTFSSDNVESNTEVIFDADIVPLRNYTTQEEFQIDVVFPQEYVINVNESKTVKCYYETTYQYYQTLNQIQTVQTQSYIGQLQCEKNKNSNNILTIQFKDITGQNYPLLKKDPNYSMLLLYNKMQIQNIINPALQGNYNIQMFVKQHDVYKERYVFDQTIQSFDLDADFFISNNLQDEISKLCVNLTTPIDLDNSNQTIENFYGNFSKLRIKFPQKISDTLYWNANLGYNTLKNQDQIQCWNLKGFKTFQQNLNCTLISGNQIPSNDDYVSVEITGYRYIQSQTELEFCFFILNHQQNTQQNITLEVIRLSQGEEMIVYKKDILPQLFVSYSSSNMFQQFYIQTDQLKPGQNTNLQIYFEVQTNITPTNRINIQIQLPEGWKFQNSQDIYSNIYFNDVQIFFPNSFFLIQKELICFDITYEIQSSQLYQININNIKVQNGTSQQNVIKVTISNDFQIEIQEEFDLGPISCTEVKNFKILTDLKGKGYEGATYEISWTNQQEYLNPKIALIFPSQYYLLDLSKDYEIEIYKNSIIKIDSFQVQNYSDRFDIKIDNYTISPDTNILIKIHYLKNPDITNINFDLKIYSDISSQYNQQIETLTDCLNFQLPDDFFQSLDYQNKGAIQNVLVIPANQNSESRIKLQYKFNISLPKYSVIKIYISEKVNILNTLTNLELYTEQGINEYANMSIIQIGSQNIIQFTILQIYNSQDIVNTTLIGYSNFQGDDQNQILFVNDFKIQATYNEQILAEITHQNNIEISPKAILTFDNVELNIDFLNASVLATYEFNIKLENAINLFYGEYFWIRFPQEYDDFLSSTFIECTSNLEGALKVQIEKKEILITGFYTQKSSNEIQITISNILNPNKVGNKKTGNFYISLMSQNFTSRIQYNNLEGIAFLKTPEVLEIIQFGSSNEEIRLNSQYNFIINPLSQIDSAQMGGRISIYFPLTYILDSFNSSCKTQDSFSLFSDCFVDNQFVVVQSSNQNFDTQKQGYLDIDFSVIRNPELKGNTSALQVRNENTQQHTIKNQSYSNVSKSYLSFMQNYLEIYINNNQIYYLEIGSFSNPIKINSLELLKDRITLVPITFDKNFIFDQNSIQLKKDTKEAYFRIAVPQQMLRKTFYITWLLASQKSVTYYSQPKKFQIEVIEIKEKRIIEVISTLYVLRGGISVPIEFKTKNPPYEQLKIKVNITNDFENKIELSQQEIEFKTLEDYKYFYLSRIDPSFKEKYIQISLEISGKDADSFQLSHYTLSIPVKDFHENQANILEMDLTQNTRKYVKFDIQCDQLSYIYCVVGRQVFQKAYSSC